MALNDITPLVKLRITQIIYDINKAALLLFNQLSKYGADSQNNCLINGPDTCLALFSQAFRICRFSAAQLIAYHNNLRHIDQLSNTDSYES